MNQTALNSLSPREREIAVLIATEGLTNVQLATRLGKSVKTVRAQVYLMCKKLQVGNRTALAILILREGIAV